MVECQPIIVELSPDDEKLTELCEDASKFAAAQKKIEQGLTVNNHEFNFHFKLHNKFFKELNDIVQREVRRSSGTKTRVETVLGLHRDAELYVLQRYQKLKFLKGVYCEVRFDESINSAGVYGGGEIRIKDLRSLMSLSHEESHAIYDLWIKFLLRNRNHSSQLNLNEEIELLNNSNKIKDEVHSVIDEKDYDTEDETNAIEDVAVLLAIVYAKNELIASMTSGHRVHGHRVSVKNLKNGEHYKYLEDWIGITKKRVLERTKLKYQERLNIATSVLVAVDNFYNEDRFVENKGVFVDERKVTTVESSLWDGRKREVRWLLMMMPIDGWNKLKETRYWKEIEEYKKFESYVGLFDQYKAGEKNKDWETIQKIKRWVDGIVKDGCGDEVLAAIKKGVKDIEDYEY